MLNISKTGSIIGQTFSGKSYNGGYPKIKSNDTYKDYRDRVNDFVKQGFNKGDLLWSDYIAYCKGSGAYEDVCEYDLIGS